jgi:hypothetical protein
MALYRTGEEHLGHIDRDLSSLPPFHRCYTLVPPRLSLLHLVDRDALRSLEEPFHRAQLPSALPSLQRPAQRI